LQNRPNIDLEVYTKDGKLRKRKRKKPNQEYFTKETEDAIIEYNSSDDPILKDRLFSDKIYVSFCKLAENNINGNVFEYAQMHAGGYEDLKNEVICKLVYEMPKFDKDKGTIISKARTSSEYTKGTLGFGYFNIIAKRFLVQYNDKQYKLYKNRLTLESQESEEKVDEIRHEYDYEDDLQNFSQEFAYWLEESIDDWFYIFQDTDDDRDVEEVSLKFTSDEKDIVRCVIELFKSVEDLEIFWKPAFYLQIREATGKSTQDITRVLNILKKAFHEQLYEFHHRGELNISMIKRKELLVNKKEKDSKRHKKEKEPDFQEFFI